MRLPGREVAMSLSLSGGVYRRILTHLPHEVSFAVAYGSGVFQQGGRSAGASSPPNTMLDFVLAVDNPLTWHTANLKSNPKHYSALRWLGPRQVVHLQDKYGAHVYYNTLVPCEGRTIKYGVISTKNLIDDLIHWKTMYISGRLHKPVKVLKQNSDSRLEAALLSNLKSAINCAFLMLPESFNEEELYLAITRLSYAGDFRMTVGEDRSKVENIVKPNVEHFRRLYARLLHENPHVVFKQTQGKLELDKSMESQFLQLMSLPRTLQQQVTLLVDPPGRNRDVEEVLLQVAQNPDCGSLVLQGIVQIVKSSSLSQSIKGIATAGLLKSIKYSATKLGKMLKGFSNKTK